LKTDKREATCEKDQFNLNCSIR